MHRAACSLLVALALAPAVHAQGGAPPAPTRAPSAILTGTWALEITFGGGVLEGSLQLSTVGDSLVARLMVGDHQSPVRAGAREGNRLVLESASPGVDVRYVLEFRGEELTGTFRYGGDTGSVTGRRNRPSGN